MNDKVTSAGVGLIGQAPNCTASPWKVRKGEAVPARSRPKAKPLKRRSEEHNNSGQFERRPVDRGRGGQDDAADRMAVSENEAQAADAWCDSLLVRRGPAGSRRD